ncbi:elongation factor G [Stenotrophomonas maltophilia]|uniref:elongation factor G n=1 Tax=Stenotrophomonas TaxID=40323 RepID=UPI00078968E0|nr:MULTISPECIES: elongation factor G [Stenotrophomonas]EKT4097450.1 elongation factor G [Stenotrophomonas maltophilia]KYK40360.1 translation elongation factor G [Stenotrophomonas maltophilia]MBA0442412.1 elongation factor G [Stenotrophomonas maltophilia]MBH1497489.1 elongation factor G [Stenotrophomonas maltophilia]MBH1533609.1 elongation factor G [Stenotrophomonas maltophilia]
MNTHVLSRRRNLGIIAHIDAGKTTLTERLLWKSGEIHRVGEVHDGNATTDFSAIERERGITIGAAAVQAQWAPRDLPPHRLTLIDTPGHIDFAIEVERSLRVLDGAVAVFSAVDGVQPQSETVWRQARRHRVPLIAFVNKMDRVGASFERVLEQLQDKLQARPWALGVPLGSESGFNGWVDLVDERVLHWQDGAVTTVTPWDDAARAQWQAQRDALVEAVADHDEQLADAWLEGRVIDAEQLRAAIRRATLAGAGVPVLAGAAFKDKGIETLLDAVVDYLPSPLDRPAVSAESDEGEVVLPPDPEGPLAGLLFKITHQQHGALSFVRLYSGTLKVGDAVASSQHPQGRRVSRLVRVQADQTHDIEQAVAGDIVAVLGWKDAVSGETLSGRAQPLRLENIQAQAPVLAWRLEPARAADLIRMAQGLASLAQEDPSFRVETDRDTAETLVWGMGELHLEVMVERLRSEWKVDVGVGAPRVAYQETPLRAMTGVVGRLVKQTGGQGQFAHVVLDVSPREDDQVVFNDRIVGGVVPRSFIAAVEKGVRAALSEGPQGHPVVGIEVSLVDGQTHAKDSSEMAFHRAGAEAIKAALAEGGTQLLEPVMAVTVHSPSASVGDVVGDLNRRHGRIARIEDQDGRAEVSGFAPLAQLVGYTTSLRSLSQGRASSEAHLHGYEPVRAA